MTWGPVNKEALSNLMKDSWSWEGSGDTSAACVQPNWDQNDEAAADYVKNRTHYISQFRQVINLNPETDSHYPAYGYHIGGYESLDPATKQDSNNIGNYWTTQLGLWAACPGTIIFDDIAIELPVQRRIPLTLKLTDGNYPMVKFSQAGSNIACSIYYDDNQPHKFEYISAEKEVKPLDDEFIPDSVARKSDLENLELSAGVKSVNGVGPDENGNVVIGSGTSDGGIGKSMAEETVYPLSTSSGVTANRGAEIFNDYAGRTYSDTTAVSGNVAVGLYSHAEGRSTTALGHYSHAEGSTTTASGDTSHAEGSFTTASGSAAHAEGSFTTASGASSHAEGSGTEAVGTSSHAEGSSTRASGKYSHAEGGGSTLGVSTLDAPRATAQCAHAEGTGSIASGVASHAENRGTASGDYSHAENVATASGQYSHAEGIGTTAASDYQHVQGRYSVVDGDGVYAHIVGNGSSSGRSNAHTLDWSGNAWFAGTIEGTAVIVKSSTEGSTKKFKITVDDSGTISATEVV